MKYKSVFLIALISVLLVLPFFANGASAQEQINYYVTVKHSILDAQQYMSVGRNATLSFEAQWTYGPNEGSFIENATVTIEVVNQKNETINTLAVNTTSGLFSFNYLLKTPDILVFNATKLVTQDGTEWNTTLLDPSNNAYGFTSNVVKVWWDTFHVSLVNYDTSNLGNIAATVNVTYLLLPQEGLTLGSGVHLSKIAEDVTVTINGVPAQQTAPGIYTATSSTWLPTAYINVKVADDYWTTTATGFSFNQNANQPLWFYGEAFASVFVLAVLIMGFLVSKKANSQLAGKHRNFPFFGAVLLVVSSVISLYWGAVGLEGTLHTFEWIGLLVFGAFAFAFGLLGSIVLLRKKHFALTITAAMIPMLMNVIAVKAALDMYHLGNPWLMLFGSLLLSLLCGFFICNTDERVQTQTLNVQTS